MSTLKVNTIQDTSGNTQYTAKAWVSFNGTGTVAINASGNVSSITDNGAGMYRINFTSSMPDIYYAVQVSGARYRDGANQLLDLNQSHGTQAVSTSYAVFEGGVSGGAWDRLDWEFAYVSVFR